MLVNNQLTKRIARFFIRKMILVSSLLLFIHIMYFIVYSNLLSDFICWFLGSVSLLVPGRQSCSVLFSQSSVPNPTAESPSMTIIPCCRWSASSPSPFPQPIPLVATCPKLLIRFGKSGSLNLETMRQFDEQTRMSELPHSPLLLQKEGILDFCQLFKRDTNWV